MKRGGDIVVSFAPFIKDFGVWRFMVLNKLLINTKTTLGGAVVLKPDELRGRSPSGKYLLFHYNISICFVIYLLFYYSS